MKLFAKMLMALKAGLNLWLGAIIFLCISAPAHAVGFASPSGNIKCYVDLYGAETVDEAGFVCLISSADWGLPPDFGDDDPICDLDATRALFLPRNGAPYENWICHGDVFWPAPLGAISYGSNWTLFNFDCSMETDGVRCTNQTGNSIALNRTRRILN